MPGPFDQALADLDAPETQPITQPRNQSVPGSPFSQALADLDAPDAPPNQQPFWEGMGASFHEGANRAAQKIIAGPALIEAGIRRFVGSTPSIEDPTPLGSYMRVDKLVKDNDAWRSQFDPITGPQGIVERGAQGLAGSVPAIAESLAAGAAARVTAMAPAFVQSLERLVASSVNSGLSTTTQEMQSDPRIEHLPYAVAQGVIEGVMGRLGGAAGIESLLRTEVGRKTIRDTIIGVGRESGQEIPEEGITGLLQGGVSQFETGKYDPNALMTQSAESMVGGGLGGGIAGSINAARGAINNSVEQREANRRDQLAANQAQSRAALTAMDPNAQRAQPTTPPRLWEDIQRQQANAQAQGQLNAIDPRTQQIADEEVDAANVAALNEQQNVEQADAQTRQQYEQDRLKMAQDRIDDMRRADQEAEKLTAEMKQLEAEKRQREQDEAMNEVQDLSNRLAAFEKETAAVANPNATAKGRAQFEIEQQRAALNEMRKELEAQRQQSAPLPDTQDDIIDAIGRAGGIQVPGRDAQGEFDAYRALPSSVKRLIAGKRSKLPEKELPPGTLNAPTLKIRPGTRIDVVAKTVMDQNGLGDGTPDTLIKLVARAAKDRAAVKASKKQQPEISAEEVYQGGVKLSRPQAKAIEPKPADTTVDKRIAASLRSRLEAAKARLASLQATRQAPAPVAPKPVVKTASPTEANVEAANRLQALSEEESGRQEPIAPQPREKAPEPAPVPQQTQQAKPPEPVESKPTQPAKKSGNVIIKGMEDLYHGFREIYGLEKDQANVAVALVRARAAALDEDPDTYVARTIAEIRHGKGSPSLNQRGKPVTTLDQGERLIPRTKLLTFEHLKKQWAKAHGDKEPVGGSQAWQELREKADKIDAEKAAKKATERAESSDTLYQDGNTPLWRFKSQEVLAKLPNKAPSEQIRKTLINNGVNERELFWLGIDDLLKSQEVTTKAEIEALLADPKLKMDETVKSGSDGMLEAAETKFSHARFRLNTVMEDLGASQLEAANFPGRIEDGRIKTENLEGELKQAAVTYLSAKKAFLELKGKRGQLAKFNDYVIPGGENYRELLITLPTSTTDGVAQHYRSSHWSEKNVLLHTRFNERTDTGGTSVLHIEEIQSDWHQEGREKGYRGELNKKLTDLDTKINAIHDAFMVASPEEREKVTYEEFDRLKKEKRELLEESNPTPDAPFAKTWEEIGLKRMIRQAAEQGLTRITWTTGEQQAERYDLSKQVELVRVAPLGDGKFNIAVFKKKGESALFGEEGIDINRIEAVLGKDLAKKISDSPVGEVSDFTGGNLKVGGEGMKAAYDQRLVSIANKIGKKYGVKVADAYLNDETGSFSNDSKQHAAAIGAEPVHSLDITPEMASDALQGMQMMFQSLNDAPGGKRTEKGAISFQADSRAILHALKSPDISTGTHELFHSFRRTLTGKDADIAARYSGAKKDKSGTWFWDREAEEKFARAAERFTRDGHIPVKALHSVFAKLSKWMREIYTSIKGTAIDQMISPEMRGVFERMLTPANEARGKQLEQGLASDEARVDVPRETKPADIIAKELTTDGKPAIQRKRVSTAAKEDLPADSDAVYDPLYGTIQIGENVTTERAAAIAQQVKDQESIDLTGKKVEVEVNGKTVQVDARAATTMLRKRLVALRSLLDCLG